MSTNALIGKITIDHKNLGKDTIDFIYLHYDGYPGNVWPILCHYNTPTKVDELLSLGHLKLIDSKIERCELFSNSGGSITTPKHKFYECIKINHEYIYMFTDVYGWALYNPKLERQLSFEHDGKTFTLL